MIVIPTGYMNSGSSAITDLISEFEDFSNLTKTQEYIFLHCPNGIFDLEGKLLNPISHLSSKQALIDFRKMMENLYDYKGWWPSYYKKSVSPNFLNYVDEYINSLIDYKFKGFWYMDEYPQKRTIKTKALNFYNRKFKGIYPNDKIEMILSYPSEEKFYNESKKFIKRVIDSMNKENKKNIVIDQLLLPMNIYKMNNYLNNAKVIVVQRDPRDVFILNKYFDKIKKYQVPYPLDADTFCKMYKSIRCNETIINNKNILRIKFEDLIYKYEESLKILYNFLEIDEKTHKNKKEKFNPDISINNTQLFLDYEAKEDIQIIEKNLKEYLYNFPKHDFSNRKEIF